MPVANSDDYGRFAAAGSVPSMLEELECDEDAGPHSRLDPIMTIMMRENEEKDATRIKKT